MSYDSLFLTSSVVINETMNISNQSNTTFESTLAIYIAFHIGQVINIICIIFGILGNTTLIFTIYRSSFCRFSFGLLLIFIAIFDNIRLIATILYYLIQAYIIPLNLITLTIYFILYRYPKNVTNWLKVFLAFERILAIKYGITNRYNINSKTTTKKQRSKQKQTLLFIFLLLICSLISQHPNLIPMRYLSSHIDSIRLLFVNTPNPNFYYGQILYNDFLFTIISYLILDDVLPIITLIILNTILLFKLRHLPLITSQKLAASIWILYFLTIFSILTVPRSFMIFFNLYVDIKISNRTIILVLFHIFQGLEMINHAITGYACFLTCQNHRKALKESIQIIYKKLSYQHKKPTNRSLSYTVKSNVVV